MLDVKTKRNQGRMRLKRNFYRMYQKRYCYLLLIPVAAYFIIFHFVPMFGVVIAFQDYNVFKGVFGSDWIGFGHFAKFFSSRHWKQLIWNSFAMNLFSILFVFPIPIIFALFLNEIKNDIFKRTIQTIAYLPHFISVVVLASMVTGLLSTSNGLVNQIIANLGGEKINFLVSAKWYRPVYLGSAIWQETGWSSVIYFAAISAVDPALYEAARVDGAGRFKQMLYVTLPAITDTIVIMLILRTGSILTVGLEKTLLLGNSANREASQVLSTYIYEEGMTKSNFGYSTAINLINSVVSLVILALVNTFCKRKANISIW